MAYYLRVLLPDWEPRPLRDLLAYGEDHGCVLRLEGGEPPQDDPHWEEALLLGPESTVPVEVEVSVHGGSGESLLHEELEEFREELQDAVGSRRRRKEVAARLDRTRAIVALRIPASDYENGLEVADAVIGYFTERSDAMVQADGEGFYKGGKLLVGRA